MNPDDIASAMVKEVMEFEKSKPENLKEVRFVIFQQHMLQAFDNALKNAKHSGGLLSSVRRVVSGRETLFKIIKDYYLLHKILNDIQSFIITCNR